jgi:hypothetical protein
MLWFDLLAGFGAAAMLVLAEGRHPYSYYTLLRVVTCAVATYLAWRSYSLKARPVSLMYLGLAALFNPFAPVRLSRQVWHPIDLVCAVAIVVGAFVINRSILLWFRKSHSSRPL